MKEHAVSCYAILSRNNICENNILSILSTKVHRKKGPQRSNWCRILALAESLQRFPNARFFIYLDHDACVRNMNLSVGNFLQTSNITLNAHSCEVSKKLALDDDDDGILPTIWPWVNTHWGCTATSKTRNAFKLSNSKFITKVIIFHALIPCTVAGTMIFRRSEELPILLRDWWKRANDQGRCDRKQPFDQGPFTCAMDTDLWAPHVKTLAEDSFADEANNFVFHRCGSCNWLPPLNQMIMNRWGEFQFQLSYLILFLNAH